jgi:peptidoglycan/LPS O-acetylase OafA/YrhL
LLSFAGGILAAMLMRFEWFRAVAPKRIYSLVVLLCLGLTILLFPSAYGIAPLVLLSLAFSLIAGGNTVFGLLSNAVSRTLGQATYSIYLLHGLVLFTVIHFVVGADVVRTFSPLHYWGMICVVTPMLVLISFATFRFIEHPAMQSAATATAWLRSIMMRSSLTRSRLADLPANHAQHQRREYAANQLESALEQQRRDQS